MELATAACPVNEASSKQKLVGRCGANGVRLVELALPSRLIAVVIKDRDGGSTWTGVRPWPNCTNKNTRSLALAFQSTRPETIESLDGAHSVLRKIARARIFVSGCTGGLFGSVGSVQPLQPRGSKRCYRAVAALAPGVLLYRLNIC